MFQPVSVGPSTTTQTLTTNYTGNVSPATGLAVSSGIGIILLMPVIVVSGLGIALYYLIKK